MKWIPLLLIVTGATVIYFAMVSHGESISSQYWPSTQGNITGTHIRIEQAPSEQSSAIYTAIINYEYTVDTKTYTNSRYSFGTTSFTSKAHTENILKPYSSNKHPNVYYSSNNPGHSVLVPGPNWAAFLLNIIIGISALFFC